MEKNLLLTCFVLVSICISIKSSLELKKFCKKAKSIDCQQNSIVCGTFLCAIDKISCRNFIEWSKIMNKYLDENKQNVYNKFVEKLKRCKHNEVANQWMHRFNFG